MAGASDSADETKLIAAEGGGIGGVESFALDKFSSFDASSIRSWGCGRDGDASGNGSTFSRPKSAML